MGIDVSIFKEIKDTFLETENLELIDEVRNYNDEALIIIKRIKRIDELEEKYLEILDTVAGYIQDKMVEKGFKDNLRWNIYLVFILKENLDYTLKNRLIEKIENDKHCCKKYVLFIDNTRTLNEELESRIPFLFNLLKMFSQSKENRTLSGNSEIPRAIENYLNNKKIVLEDFFNQKFDIELIEEIYKAEDGSEN